MGKTEKLEANITLASRREIFGIVERGESSYWTRIGAALENRDGSWSLRFDYLPARGDIKLRMVEQRRGPPQGD
jgi:hypothetical protein